MTKQLSFSDGAFSTLTERIFLVLLGSYLVVGTLRTTSLEYTLPPLFTAAIASGLVIIIAAQFFLLHAYSIKETALYSVIFALVLVVALRNHHDTLLMLFLLVVASKGIEFHKIVVIQLISVSEVLLFSAVLSQTGISADYGGFFFDSPYKTFGICNTTDFASYILFLVLSYTYLRGTRITYTELILFVAGDMWIYKQTHAKTAFCGLLFFCLLVVIYKLMARFPIDFTKLRIAPLGMLLMPLLSFLMLGFSFLYSEQGELMKRIDGFFTQRIMLGHMGIEQYGITLFGNNVIESGYGFREKPISYFFLDSSYMRLFLIDGLLVYFIIMVIYCHVYKKLLAGKDSIGLIVFFIVAITCTTEQRLLEPWYNPLTLLCLTNLASEKGHLLYENLNNF